MTDDKGNTCADLHKSSTTIIEEHMTNIDGHPIGYARYGHGHINLLFIPGGVGCYAKDYPESVLRAFDPTKVTIVVIDPPGYGKSRPPNRKQAVNRCQLDAKYCIQLMQQLELVPFTVVGWSEGGRTAIHVADQAKMPTVTKLIILCTSTRIDARGSRVFQSMRNTDQWLPTAKEEYLKHYDEDYFREQWSDLCNMITKVYHDLGGRFPSDYCLKGIRQPTLAIYGGLDRFCMDQKYYLEHVKNCRLLTHAQGSHDLHIKYPSWFAEQVQMFAVFE